MKRSTGFSTIIFISGALGLFIAAILAAPSRSVGRASPVLPPRARTLGPSPFLAAPFHKPPGLSVTVAHEPAGGSVRALVFPFRQVGRERMRHRRYKRTARYATDQLTDLGFKATLSATACATDQCAIDLAKRQGFHEAWVGTVHVQSKIYASGRVHHLHLYRYDANTGKLKSKFDKIAEIHYGNPFRPHCRKPRKARSIGCGNHHIYYIAAWLVRFIVNPPKRPKPIPQKPVPAHKAVAGMAFVPAGDFVMGGYFGEFDEEPEHLVYLSAYYFDKYETSNAEYWECVRARYCKIAEYWRLRYLMGKRYPVFGVSWFDARGYCRWRGKRLPTEAEMEKAARGTDGRRYPWGNVFDRSKINLRGKEDGYKYTAPVDSFANGVSPYGVHHIAGNMWEWCHDNVDKQYYKRSPRRDPKGPPYKRGMRKCMRGGTWMYNVPFYGAVTNRSPQWGWKRYKYTGIRCALSAADRDKYLRHKTRLDQKLKSIRRRLRRRRGRR